MKRARYERLQAARRGRYQPPGTGGPPDVVYSTPAAVGRTRPTDVTATGTPAAATRRTACRRGGRCLAQWSATRITQRAPWVDVVYGTHNMITAVAAERARLRNEAPGRVRRALETFPSLLPARRQSATRPGSDLGRCQQTCTSGIVPAARQGEGPQPGRILGRSRTGRRWSARVHRARPEVNSMGRSRRSRAFAN